MNGDLALRIVALNRKVRVYGADRARGDITEDEYKALVAPLHAEIATIRQQRDLAIGKK